MPHVLKPCPFCGGAVNLRHNSPHMTSYYTIDCADCSSVHLISKSEYDAVENWNTRANEDKWWAEVVELRACLLYVLRRMFFSRGKQRTIQEFKDFVKKSEES